MDQHNAPRQHAYTLPTYFLQRRSNGEHARGGPAGNCKCPRAPCVVLLTLLYVARAYARGVPANWEHLTCVLPGAPCTCRTTVSKRSQECQFPLRLRHDACRLLLLQSAAPAVPRSWTSCLSATQQGSWLTPAHSGCCTALTSSAPCLL